MKTVLAIVGAFVGLWVLVAALDLLGLQWFRFIGPKRESVRREVFEETKSYVHGAAQDLAKYKAEYDKATDGVAREAVASVVRSRFAEFDEANLQSAGLRRFLVQMRGY